jgi:hypothetical protein
MNKPRDPRVGGGAGMSGAEVWCWVVFYAQAWKVTVVIAGPVPVG